MRTDGRTYRITFGASHTEGYEVDIIQRLMTFGIAIAPVGVHDASTLPSPAGFPVGGAASVPQAPVATRPTAPWSGANVMPAKSGNGFKAWDQALGLTWLYNDDERTLTNGQPGQRVWKANTGGKGRFGHWVGISERPGLLAGAVDSGSKRAKRG